MAEQPVTIDGEASTEPEEVIASDALEGDMHSIAEHPTAEEEAAAEMPVKVCSQLYICIPLSREMRLQQRGRTLKRPAAMTVSPTAYCAVHLFMYPFDDHIRCLPPAHSVINR